MQHVTSQPETHYDTATVNVLGILDINPSD